MNLKKAISLTVVAIFIVFAVIAVIYFVGMPGGGSIKAKADGKTTVHYTNGLKGNAQRIVERKVNLYAGEWDEIKVTRANDTKLLTEKESGFTYQGFSFGGWKYWTEDESGEVIDDGYVPGEWDPKEKGEMWLVVHWIPNEYFISFNPEYPGMRAPQNLKIKYDAAIYGISTIYAPYGSNLVFNGWFTQKNGKGKQVKEGDINKFTAHTILYAYWLNPNDASHYRTVTVRSQLTNGQSGPFQTFSATHLLNTVLEFHLHYSSVNGLTGYDQYRTQGYTFSHFHINGTNYLPGDFQIKGSNPVFLVELTTSFTIIAFYTYSGGSGGGGGTGQTFTITVKSADDLYGGVGPFDQFSQSYAAGTQLEFWLYLNSNTYFGYDDYYDYGEWQFSHFSIGTQKYYPGGSGSGWSFKNYVFIITLNSNMTITAHYI